jgi:glycosyltransferase involved in cell wall biosynthesis
MNFSAQSNFGIKKAKGEWSLLIDADEIITPELALEIRTQLSSWSQPAGEAGEAIGSPVAYQIPRTDYFLGKKLRYGETRKSRVTRLVRKGKGEWSRRVHPTLNIEGQLGTLKNPILHYPHQSIQEFLISINRWSFWHSLALNEENKKSSTIKITLWPILKFIQNYILRLGFLDGTHGFVHAVIMSFHSFLGWSNLYVKTHK